MHLSSNSSLHRAVKKLQSRYYDWHTDPQKPYSSGPKPNRTPKGTHETIILSRLQLIFFSKFQIIGIPNNFMAYNPYITG